MLQNIGYIECSPYRRICKAISGSRVQKNFVRVLYRVGDYEQILMKHRQELYLSQNVRDPSPKPHLRVR